MKTEIYNLFLELDKFNILGYVFYKVHTLSKDDFDNYRFGNSKILTYMVEYDFEDKKSIFFGDTTQLNDIILLLGFFLGFNAFFDDQIQLSGGYYFSEPIESKDLLAKTVIPKIEYLLTEFTRETVKERRLHILIFLYFELNKTPILDIKLGIISQMINVLIDIYSKKYKIENPNEKIITQIEELRNKLNDDTYFSGNERELLAIGLIKYRDSLSTDFTTKLVNFIYNLFISQELELANSEYEPKIKEFAQLVNTLRNAILHSGDMELDRVEKKFIKTRLDINESTFDAKFRVYVFAEILVTNAILEIMGISDYFFKTQDKRAILEYLTKGTIRGN